MKDMKTLNYSVTSPHPPTVPTSILGSSIKMLVTAWLLVGSVVSSSAAYVIKTQVDHIGDTYRYTWTVHNQGQSWGLDVFVIEVPVETRVLAHTVPPPYSNPHGNAYWRLGESRDAQVDPHDGQAWLGASRPGKKWIIWGGAESPSVYPPGTTAIFSLTTDTSVKPGPVRGTATTYTPQNNPHYYFPFHGEVIGPSAHVTGTDAYILPSTSFLQTMDGYYYTVLSTNLASTSVGSTTPTETTVSLSMALYPGLTIDGRVGQIYGIEYSPDLANPASWRGLANVILSAPKQTWIDSQPSWAPQRYYRIVQGPISIP